MRNENEWFDFVEKGEQISAKSALAYLKETAKCWLTGESTNLTTFPVDFNPDNILPTNMVSLKKAFLETETLPKTYYYNLKLGDYILKFHTPEFLEAKNREIVAGLDLSGVDFSGPSSLYGVWDFLTTSHVKGLEEIKYGDYSIESYIAMSYFIKKTTLNHATTNSSKLQLV